MKTIKGEQWTFPDGKERRRSGFTVILGGTMMWCLGTSLMPAQVPTLEAEQRGDQFILRWPASSTGYVVEQSADLQNPWSVASGVAEEVEDQFELGIDSGEHSVMFYRHRPQAFELPSFMGLVQDDQSSSLAEAIVGELQPTDESGIFSGTVRESASGWITVTSMGHATAFVAPSVRIGDTDLVEAWLTPFGDQQALEGSGNARLFLGDSGAPEVEVPVSPLDFAENPVILGLAEIDPLNVGPLFGGGLSPAGGTTPISVTQRQMFMTKEDDRCVYVQGYPVEIPFPNYYSVLMHGFLSSPPITLQEMLESGTRSDDPLGETISGYERVSNDYPAPNFGRYPFTSGLITWTFIHYKKLLPLDP